MKVRCLARTGEFEAGREYEIHVHSDCLHYVEPDGHHFRILDAVSGEWFFDHFEFVTEESDT